MTLSPDRLKELREIAESATPGPWEMYYTFGSKDLPCEIRHSDGTKTVLEWTEQSTSSCADVEFIAALNPTQVLELLDEIERLQLVISNRSNIDKAIDDALVHGRGAVRITYEDFHDSK